VRRALWLYLFSREDGEDPDASLFVGKFNRPMNRDVLRQVIASLSEKVGVKNCHPHRFRRTFALTYLREGGDVFILQALLEHRSLDMVQYYARIAEIDIERVHRRASPADNWRL
jgi:integrase/recombinase XerD